MRFALLVRIIHNWKSTITKKNIFVNNFSLQYFVDSAAEAATCFQRQPLLFVTHVCNLSLSEGIFHDELKVANVIPLYKADDVFAFNNYRPVSLLCILSKVFEKIMYNRLIDFLETYKILVKFQFGLRKFHSTYMALMILMDKLITALENGEHVIGIFLDFSKAFDTVDHEILLKKDAPFWYQRNSIQIVSELLIKPKTICNL